MDDFIPKHIAVIEETIHHGELIEDDNKVVQVPGFYVMGVQISLICDIEPENLMYYPIQIIPYAIIFFTFLYFISGSTIIASLLTFIELCSGTTGTLKIFFWPHGIGYILFVTILILIYMLIKKDKYLGSEPYIFLLAVLVSASLVYISYNLTAMALILLATIILLSILFQKVSRNSSGLEGNKKLSTRTIYSLFLIMTIVVFGLSQFVYGVFIPTLYAAQNFQISGLDKFLLSFFNVELSANPLGLLLIRYPDSISLISGVKYGIMAIVIIVFCIFIFRHLRKERVLNITQVFLLAILTMSAIYSIPRVMIGGIVIASLWLPGIFMIAYFYKISIKWKTLVSVIIVIILACTMMYYFIMDDNGFIDRDEYRFSSYRTPVLWFINYNNGEVSVSDEMTNDFFILHSLEYSISNNTSSSVDAISQQSRLLTDDDVLTLVQLSDGKLDSKYFILNEKLSRMSLQSWLIIEAWAKSADRIQSNDQVNKIYTVPQLSIYYP